MTRKLFGENFRHALLDSLRPPRQRRRDYGISLDTHSFRYQRMPAEEGLWEVDELTSKERTFLGELLYETQVELRKTLTDKQYYQELPLLLSEVLNLYGIACPHPRVLIVDGVCMVCYVCVIERVRNDTYEGRSQNGHRFTH